MIQNTLDSVKFAEDSMRLLANHTLNVSQVFYARTLDLLQSLVMKISVWPTLLPAMRELSISMYANAPHQINANLNVYQGQFLIRLTTANAGVQRISISYMLTQRVLTA